ncbi:MAG: hypothetical protein KF760_03415 [Candidatus Eremiobacteraeota bacterium]|nr:hypothetical protein [Candidatus Eremiobacteraeota bacterium]MCW5872027.1 hypothetical protein [Candidatus Eremiobacteraeota bacterium]
MASGINFGGGIPQYGGYNNFQANNFNSGFGASPFSGSPVNPFNAVQVIQQLISAMAQLSGQWGGILGQNGGNAGSAGNIGGAGNVGGAGSAYGGGGNTGGAGSAYGGGGNTGGAGSAYGGGGYVAPAPQTNVAVAVNATPPKAQGGGAGAYG